MLQNLIEPLVDMIGIPRLKPIFWVEWDKKRTPRIPSSWDSARAANDLSIWVHRRIATLCLVYPFKHVAAEEKSQALQAFIDLSYASSIEHLISDSRLLNLSCPQVPAKVGLSDIISEGRETKFNHYGESRIRSGGPDISWT